MKLFQSCRVHLCRELSLSSHKREIAEKLFAASFTDSVPLDPRGMSNSKLKQELRRIGVVDSFETLHQHAPEILSHWRNLYQNHNSKPVKLPGAEKAGPLTFIHEKDSENVRDLYDQHGRVNHGKLD